MGTLGSSSQMATNAEAGIKTKLFQQKYIDRLSVLKMLTPGQRDGIYQEIAHEEALYFANLDAAALEYQEIMDAMDAVNGLDVKP